MSPKTDVEIQAMRESGAILAQVLSVLKAQTTASMTPKDASMIARQELKALGGQPVFLNYHGFPDIICISVNQQVQHAIPTNIPLKAGDVVNYDFGVNYRGMITDGGITVCVDNALTNDTRRLLEGTEQALQAGIATVKAGCRVGDVSAAIETVLRKHDLGIVRELVGHGVGHALHEDPEVPNYGKAGRGPVLKAGMTIAIEPIATLGSHEITQLHDGWTLITRDGSWAAQFEHTILVTEAGSEILTKA
jgi:methionyl aminopeptidase